MTNDELKWLIPQVTNAHVFEWGSGVGTVTLSNFATRITSVEHDPIWFCQTLLRALSNGTVLKLRTRYVPPTMEWDFNSQEDGDGDTFSEYVDSLAMGSDYETILVDGRARIACLDRVRMVLREQPAEIWPTVFLDDYARDDYVEAWEHWRIDESHGTLARVVMK